MVVDYAVVVRCKSIAEEAMIPTIGYSVESIAYRSVRFEVWDVGDQDKLRPLWKHYFTGAPGIVYLADSASSGSLQESDWGIRTTAPPWGHPRATLGPH